MGNREPGRANTEWRTAQLVSAWDLRDVLREAETISLVPWCWWWSRGRDGPGAGTSCLLNTLKVAPQSALGTMQNQALPGGRGPTTMSEFLYGQLFSPKAAIKHNKTYFSGDGTVSCEVFKEAAGERALSREIIQLERTQGISPGPAGNLRGLRMRRPCTGQPQGLAHVHTMYRQPQGLAHAHTWTGPRTQRTTISAVVGLPGSARMEVAVGSYNYLTY